MLKTANRDNPADIDIIDWVDYVKGVGIFFVVLGHTIIGLRNASIIAQTPFFDGIVKFLYAFHMPLFFFISGLFVERSLRKPLSIFFISKLQVIAYPYLIWSVLQGSLQIFSSRYTNNQKISWQDILEIGYKPIMQFWFLYTLLAILLVYGIWRKVFKFSSTSFLLFAIAIYCLHVFNVSFGGWGILYLSRRHAIYFALGTLVGTSSWLGKISQLPNFAFIFPTIGGFTVVGLSVYYQIANNGWLIPPIALMGTIASIAIAILISRIQRANFVKTWGLLSLEIFVAHSIASSVGRNLLQKLFQFSLPIPHLVIGVVIGLYGPIFLDWLCQKLQFRYLFTLSNHRRKLKTVPFS